MKESEPISITSLPGYERDLDIMLSASAKIKAAKSNNLVAPKPIFIWDGIGFINPNTVNIIQGQTGVHKSRLVSIMIQALIKKEDCDNEHLGIVVQDPRAFAVVNIDTERNLKFQYPLAVQQTVCGAGYTKDDNPENFYYSTLLPVTRKNRTLAIQEYIEEIRDNGEKRHLVVFIDVITDCVNSFNDASESMLLIDYLNMQINDTESTFIVVIHENPGSNKARGHTGTELANKASTVLQASFVPNSKEIKFNFLKTRDSEKLPPKYAKFCPDRGTLVSVASNELEQTKNDFQSLDELFISFFSPDASKEPLTKDLIPLVQSQLGYGEKRSSKMIKSYIDETPVLKIQDTEFNLVAKKVGTSRMHQLKFVDDNKRQLQEVVEMLAGSKFMAEICAGLTEENDTSIVKV